MASSVRTVVFLLFVSGCDVKSQRNIVPEATLEFLNPSGLKISIPGDNPAVTLVAFHININEEFYGVEHGQFAADITKKRNGRWTWLIPQFMVKQGDVIYYWINVIETTQSYNGLDREYKVTANDPHGGQTITNPTTTTTTTPVPRCNTSQTTLNGRMSSCRGDVLLNKRFDTMEGWSHQVTIGGDYLCDEFMVFMKEPFASWVDRGKLFIKPSLLEDKFNDTFVRSGVLQIEGCTSFVPDQCIKRANSYLILPPIISARLNTKNKFSFRYGTVEIRAKLPRGKWIVPELWLEPVNGPAMERVVMGLSRGNTDDSEFGWRTLEVGVMGESQSSLEKRTRDSPWSDDFHTFKLQWTPDQMQFSVDNQEIHQVSSDGFPIVNKEVYITLGVHVAGNKDFPDTISGKPWKNSDPKRFLRFWDAKNSWYPSWNQESALQVEHIKITAI